MVETVKYYTDTHTPVLLRPRNLTIFYCFYHAYSIHVVFIFNFGSLVQLETLALAFFFSCGCG
jgi:hypothetical protein